MNLKSVKFRAAEQHLNEHPDKTFKACQKALGSLTLSNQESPRWIELKQKTETAISEKRRTNPGFAPNIILSSASTSLPFSIQERVLENENLDIDPISSNLNKPEGKLEKLLQSYQDHIKAPHPVTAFSLCKDQLNKFSDEQNQESDGSTLIFSKTLEEKIWKILHQYTKCKQLFYIKKRSNRFTVASKILLEQKEKIKDLKVLMQKKFLIIPDNIRSQLINISTQEQISLASIKNNLPNEIECHRKKVYTFLNPPVQQGINWDRFAKLETDASVFTRIIDPEAFPQIYKMAFDCDKKINDQAFYRFIYTISTITVTSLATAIGLYQQNYQAELYIAIPLFMFAYSLLLSILYFKISIGLADEALMQKIKNLYNPSLKQSN